MRLMYFAILLLTVSLTGQAVVHDVRTNDNHRAYVQAICDWSHTHNSGALEQRCGDAQDNTNTEYLCVSRSNDLNCWVEVK